MISYGIESLQSSKSEVEDMLPAQWQHTGDSDLKCEPHWPIYEAMEKVNSGFLLIARDNDRAVGYLVAIFHPHLNSRQSLVGTVSTYFVEDRPSRAFILRGLFQAAIDEMMKRPVARINIDTEYHNSCGILLERLGFEPVRIGYMMKTDMRRQ